MRKRVKESLQKSLIRLLVGDSFTRFRKFGARRKSIWTMSSVCRDTTHAGAKLLGVVW
jgi:hypothetical protein